MSCTDAGILLGVDVTLTTATFNLYFVNSTPDPLSGFFFINITDPQGITLNQQGNFADIPAAEGIDQAVTFTGLKANTKYSIIDCWFTSTDPNCPDQYTISNLGSFTTLAPPPPPPPPPPSGTAPLIVFIELIVFIYALLQILL
jgi:hypothetical protein